MSKILLVEDNKDFAMPVDDYLTFQGHSVEWVKDAEEALLRIRVSRFDLLILDWELPGMSGLELLKQLRKSEGVSVLMLTGRSSTVDKIAGLETGADDYLAKPFDLQELASRVKALLRRPQSLISDVLTVGPMVIDFGGKSCTVNGAAVPLNASEYTLLEFFAKHSGQIFTVDALFDRIWRSDSTSSVDAVRQCITRLRRKLRAAEAPNVIRTSIGSGYKFDPSNLDSPE